MKKATHLLIKACAGLTFALAIVAAVSIRCIAPSGPADPVQLDLSKRPLGLQVEADLHRWLVILPTRDGTRSLTMSGGAHHFVQSRGLFLLGACLSTVGLKPPYFVKMDGTDVYVHSSSRR